MEQVVKILLKRQGIENIGIINQEMNIWVYVKDNIIHFCKDDLTEIDRDTLGIKQSVVVLSESESSFHVVNNNEKITNFIVIDENNTVLLAKNSDINDTFLLKTIDGINFVIIHSKRLEECDYTAKKSWVEKTYIVPRFKRYKAYAFINNRYYPDYYLGFIYKNTFFFSYSTENNQAVIAINDKHGVIYHEEGETPYIWIHENGDAQIISVRNLTEKDGEYKLWYDYMKEDGYGFVKIVTIEDNWTYNYKISDYVLPVEFDHHCIMDTSSEITLYSNNNVILPFLRNMAFVIHYVPTWNPDQLITGHTIKFNETFCNTYSSSKKIVFQNDIIKIEESGENGRHDYFYDIYGTSLGTYDHKDIYNHYFVFSVPNKSLFSNKISRLQGVIEIFSNNVLIPPMFENVTTIDDENGIFEVTFINYVKGKKHETKGLYSIAEGFIFPEGTERKIEDMINQILPSNKHKMKDHNDVDIKDFIEDEDNYVDFESEYTQKDLDRMYREAYEEDPEAQWNTD